MPHVIPPAGAARRQLPGSGWRIVVPAGARHRLAGRIRRSASRLVVLVAPPECAGRAGGAVRRPGAERTHGCATAGGMAEAVPPQRPRGAPHRPRTDLRHGCSGGPRPVSRDGRRRKTQPARGRSERSLPQRAGPSSPASWPFAPRRAFHAVCRASPHTVAAGARSGARGRRQPCRPETGQRMGGACC